jgi:ankyrin repeat protein
MSKCMYHPGNIATRSSTNVCKTAYNFHMSPNPTGTHLRHDSIAMQGTADVIHPWDLPGPFGGNHFRSSLNIYNSDDDDDAEEVCESDSDEDDESEPIPLYVACASGDKKTVERLLSAGGFDIEKKFRGYTALLRAVCCGYVNIIKMLLAHGADPSAVQSRGLSSIMLAAQWKLPRILRLLLEHNPVTTEKMINMRTKSNYSALEFAAVSDDVDIARMLIKHGADVNQEDSQGRNVLHFAIGTECSTAFIKVILENGVDVHHEDNDGENALVNAFVFKKYEIIKLLMDAGLSLDKCNKKGVSLAHGAAKWGGRSMAEFLVLNKAACLDSKSMSGKTPCSTAELYRNFGVKMIFKNNITKNRADAKRAKR